MINLFWEYSCVLPNAILVVCSEKAVIEFLYSKLYEVILLSNNNI